jgi:multisubunit Na+/H+ antiporter MnhC subunit
VLFLASPGLQLALSEVGVTTRIAAPPPASFIEAASRPSAYATSVTVAGVLAVVIGLALLSSMLRGVSTGRRVPH